MFWTVNDVLYIGRVLQCFTCLFYWCCLCDL